MSTAVRNQRLLSTGEQLGYKSPGPGPRSISDHHYWHTCWEKPCWDYFSSPGEDIIMWCPGGQHSTEYDVPETLVPLAHLLQKRICMKWHVKSEMSKSLLEIQLQRQKQPFSMSHQPTVLPLQINHQPHCTTPGQRPHQQTTIKTNHTAQADLVHNCWYTCNLRNVSLHLYTSLA